MSKLTDALQNNDVRGIKTGIIATLSADPLDKSGDVKKALAVISSKNLSIWQAHDQDFVLTLDSTKWTKEYFSDLQSNLVTNFSKEGVEHALKVGRHAYREELNRPKEPVRPSRPTNQSSSQGGQDNTGKLVLAGVAAAAMGIALYMIFK